MENLMINDESSRLDALKSLDILDSEPEEFFDTITKIASTIVQVPISLVSLIDKDRQWFKSKQGIDVSETPRNISFCTHAVEQGEKLIVEDALLDERFSQNPLVKDNPHIRFYAGIPIKSIGGYSIGTLCVIDSKPKKLTDSELLALEDLAELATREIRFRERIKATQKSLVITENKFKNIFDNAAIGIAMVEPNGRWREVNDELCNIVGYPREELMQLTFQDITHPEDLETDLSLLHQLVTGKLKRYQLEKRYIKKDGSSIWIELTVTMQKTTNGEVDYFCSVIKDIQSAKENEIALNSLRKTLEDKVNQRTKDLNYANQNLVRAFEQKIKSEQLLQKKELELRSILDNANDAYVCMNLDGDVIAWNKQAEVTFGWKEHEAVGKKLERLIIPDEHVAAHQAGMKRFAMVKTSKLMGKRIELEAIRKDGSRIPIELCINMIESDDSTIITSFLRDISDRKQLESLLKKQAFNDPLTGLPNRRKIDEILPIAIQRAQINQGSLSVLFLDLDGFKAVNDNYGHSVGDMLLREVANRIDKSTRQTDTVARYAGDEFLVVLEAVGDVEQTTRIAEKILSVVSMPFLLGKHTIHITVSIGIAHFNHAKSSTMQAIDLIKMADSAMYVAKKNGKNGIYYIHQ